MLDSHQLTYVDVRIQILHCQHLLPTSAGRLCVADPSCKLPTLFPGSHFTEAHLIV
jgi:hypothetical protein